MFQTPTLTTKAKQLALVNGFVKDHDYICQCSNPAFHCLLVLTKQLAPELKPEEKQQIKECLTTTTEEPTGDADIPDIGDLERIFAEDDTEDVNG